MKSVRLYISVPSNRDWKGGFGTSIINLDRYLTGRGIKTEGYNLEAFVIKPMGQSSCLSRARQFFVDDMILNGANYWLSLDDDMAFPYDLVDRLIKHDKDVVAINARHKTVEPKGSLVSLELQHLDSTGKTGLEEIHSFGGAIFLAKVDCFKNIPKPHFQVLWSHDLNDYVSEDRYFSVLLKESGIKSYCDHDASQDVHHIGDYAYKW